MYFDINRQGLLETVDLEDEVEVTLPAEVIAVDDYVFFKSNIETLVMPDSVIYIKYMTFSGCHKLRNVVFSKSMQKIGANSFSFCDSLKSIDFPDSLKTIENNAFLSCKNLKNVELKNSIDYIGKSAFENCSKIEEISVPQSVSFIGEAAFRKCKSLKKVTLPKTLKKINNETFCYCSSLKEVHLPQNLENLGEGAFYECISLEEVTLPKTLKKIGNEAFYGCENLKTLSIPVSVEDIGYGAFEGCINLNTIKLGNYFNLFSNSIQSRLSEFTNIYLDKDSKEIVLSKEPLCELDKYKKLDYQEYKKVLKSNKATAICVAAMFDLNELNDRKFRCVKSIFNKMNGIGLTKDTINEISKHLSNIDEFNDFVDHNFAKIRGEEEVIYNIFSFAYSIGMFDEDKAVRISAVNFINNILKSEKIDVYVLSDLVEGLGLDYRKDWANFIMSSNNFEKIANMKSSNDGLIAKIHSNFDKFKNLCTLKNESLTLDFCVDHVSQIDIDEIDEESVDIVKELHNFRKKQDAFDDAKRIRKEYLKLKKEGMISDHILGDELKETIFNDIDNSKKDILNNMGDTLKNLDTISSNEFTWEFLSKYDPANFALGVYCSCYSHLEGMSYGEMKVSILNPECQNLVIRDKEGRIVAKSTLYVNKRRGYGVFNTVEVSGRISEEEKDLIYEKYKQAVRTFALEYNKRNPSSPIRRINVGMTNNDLSEIIINKNKPAILLEGLVFSQYDKSGRTAEEDWEESQYSMWDYMEEKIKKR